MPRPTEQAVGPHHKSNSHHNELEETIRNVVRKAGWFTYLQTLTKTNGELCFVLTTYWRRSESCYIAARLLIASDDASMIASASASVMGVDKAIRP